MTQRDEGILAAWRMDAAGAKRLQPTEAAEWRPGEGTLWVHLDRMQPGTHIWLEEVARLDPFVVDTLLEEETRPRVLRHGDGLVVNLRGVNLSPGAEPEDMVSVRMWIDADRLISMRGPAVLAADDVSRTLAAGEGPARPGELLVALADGLVSRMRPVVGEIEDAFDEFEEALTNEATADPSAARISEVRRRAIELRRYLAPQREVLTELADEAGTALTDDDRRALRQGADRVTRLVEDLDVARERGAVTHEEGSERLSKRMNRNMYLLSIVALVFLPLTFITGLLGINVGGIPGAETGWAFLAVCGLLAVLLAAEIWFLRRRQWMD